MWKAIKLFKWYEISRIGEIRSKSYNKTNQVKILKQNNWYCMLHNKWKVKNIKVWRLVAQAFMWLNIEDKNQCVIHKDWNKMNNRMGNLKLWTRWDWQRHYLNNNNLITHKERRGSAIYKMQTEDIIRLKNEWHTLSKISEEIWLSVSYISMICNWKRRVYKHKYWPTMSIN